MNAKSEDGNGKKLETLEDLFTDAALHLPSKPAPKERNIRATYLSPENWLKTSGVALIHAETETLLGNFEEYQHKSVIGCRKLVRVEEPIAIQKVEKVSGDWYLRSGEKPVARQEWHTVEQVTFPTLPLPGLELIADLVVLNVYLSFGAISRVELADPTQFFAIGGKACLMISLPAGTNVMEVMERQSKIQLKTLLAGIADAED